MDDLNIPTFITQLIHGYISHDLMYHLILYVARPIFHFPLPLESIQFQQDNVTWYELDCAGTFIIIMFLPVCSKVGLKVCFYMGLFEASLYVINVLEDSARAHTGTWGNKIEICWKVQTPSKHKMMQ